MTFGVPVSLVTIHHEGAGNPVDWARGGEGGYSLWIGDVGGDRVYDVLRNPWISYATLNFNHVSLDICLSGNRCVNAVTPADIDTIRRAVAQARSLGWVVDAPYVRSHHDSPGSSTVCPCTHALEPLTWLAIVTACHKEAPPMPPTVAPQYFPPLSTVSVLAIPGVGVWGLADDGGIFTYEGHFYGTPHGKTYFAGRHGAKLVKTGSVVAGAHAPLAPYSPAHPYEVIATSGERYGSTGF